MTFRERVRLAVAMAAVSFCSVPLWADEYRLRPGDVLDIDVAGLAGMKQRLPVNVDGSVRVPLIGGVEAGGKSLDEVARVIQSRMSSQSLRQTTSTGQEFQIFFEPSQIMVSIAEYRPVYISGDVARPGQQPYRPGMTVRQVVSLAGGYELIRSRGVDPVIALADLRSELNAHWIDLAREQLRIQRINAELAGAAEPPSFALEGVPLAADVIDSLMRLERDRFLVNAADYAKEKTFLKSAIENTIGQSATLTEQQQKEQEGLEADVQDLNRVTSMEKKGTTTATRVTDARRSVLLSSTRFLQTTSQIGQFRKELAETNRRLEKLDDARRTDLLKEYQDAVARSNTTSTRIKSTMEKLTYTTGGRFGAPGPAEIKPVIAIVRDFNGDISKIAADEDTELRPGDVVEASMRSADTAAKVN